MSRYKGRASTKSIERNFPHVVEIAVPDGGLGMMLDAMHDFHTRHSIQAHTRRRHEDGRDYIRWSFAGAAKARDFANAFVALD